MKINKIALLNFRCFQRYSLKPADRFTLLIGDNGSGKTAILDALAIALGDFVFEISDINFKDKRRLSLDDMRYVELTMGQTPLKEVLRETFISIDGVFCNTPIEWINGRGAKKFYCLSKHDLDDVNDPFLIEINSHVNKIHQLIGEKTNPNVIFPIAAYYGTGRLWQQLKTKDKKTQSPGSRFDGYQDCLNPASDQKRFFSWFKTQELASLQKQERRHVLEAVREAIVSMIPNAKRAWWDLDWDELRIETLAQEKQQTIPFHLLSDGYRNMIGMVADIAFRMATLNPQLEADVIKQTEGIVLIDEIDLHLHPKWQRQVVERLLNTFPKVQFIATSHSPFIIQSLYHRKDALVWDLEKAQPLAIESESIEDIAEDQQHVEIPQKSKRFLDMMEAAEAYYRKIHEVNDATNADVMSLRARLDELAIPFSDDPAFAAQLKFERETLLASKGD